MKNLHLALRILSRVRARVEFTIFATIKDRACWAECTGLIATLPPNVTARHAGPVAPDDVWQVLSGHDLFFLPTAGENYGHVIHEALASGLPALISDQTPWQDLRDKGVGWALPLDREAGFAEVIEDVAGWTADARAACSARAAAYAAARFGDSGELENYRRMFSAAIAGQS